MGSKIFFKFLIFSWVLLPAAMLSWLISGYIGNAFQASASTQVESALNEVPKALPAFTPFKSEGKGAATIFFSGGWQSQYDYGYQKLNKQGQKAAISVITAHADYPGYINWKEIKTLQDKGWEIISGGKSYNCKWDELTSEQVREEVYGSKRDFYSHGISAEHFSAACGLVDIRLSDKVAYYYKSQKIGEEGNNQLPLENVFLLKGRTLNSKTTLAELESWLNDARTSNQWIIFTFNQISDSDDGFSVSKDKFGTFINKINESGIEIVLPSQVVEYNKKEGGQ